MSVLNGFGHTPTTISLTSFTGGNIPNDVVTYFQSRVEIDGGTVVDETHNQSTRDAISSYGPSLICTCDSSKAGVLYSMIENFGQDVLKVLPTTSNENQFIVSSESATELSNSNVFVSFDYYIKSGANANHLVWGSLLGPAQVDTVQDAWARAEDGFASGSATTTLILVVTNSLGSATFAGDGDVASGVIYVSNVSVSTLGVSAKADVNANDITDAVYSFNDVPKVAFTYALNGASLNVTVTDLTTNPYGNFRLYEATDHRAQFSGVANVTLPHTRTVTVGDSNFKHKVNYIANGTKNGSPYVVESQSSRPAYYINAKNKI